MTPEELIKEAESLVERSINAGNSQGLDAQTRMLIRAQTHALIAIAKLLLPQRVSVNNEFELRFEDNSDD